MRNGLWLMVLVLLLGCAAPASAPQPAAGSSGGAPSAPAPTGPKRITFATLLSPSSLLDNRARPMSELMISGMTTLDPSGKRQAVLEEALPTIDNGLWQVFPDGTMQTTHRLREGAKFHDGQPITSEDLLFTAQLAADKEMPVGQLPIRDPSFDLIDRVEATDGRTVVVHWKEPYIQADAIFSLVGMSMTSPLPKHILEAPYAQDKTSIVDLPFWTTSLVSTGPFKLREYVPGSRATLDAFDGYVLGRPKVDEVDLLYIQDPNTLVAGVLAGSTDLTSTRAISADQGVQLRDQWKGGTMATSTEGWTMMYPELHAPDPVQLLDPQYRRALVLAIDRQAMAEEIMLGLSPVADSIIQPDQAEYEFVKDSIVRYPYDPQRAAQMFQALGLTKGADGMLRDASGQLMTERIQTTVNDTSERTTLAIADYWKRAGIDSQPKVMSTQEASALNRYDYKGFELVNQSTGAANIINVLYSPAAPLPERNFRAPNSALNRGAYVNADYDAVMRRYVTTIPIPQRMQVLADLVHRQTDEQLVMGMFYSVNAVMVASRLQNVIPASALNAQNWDVTS